MFGDLHIHMILDGVYYRAAIDAQKEHPLDGLVRARLSDYQARGVCLLRDGGDAWGVSLRARELAGEYGIDYRSPAFPIYRRGHYGAFIGRGFDTEEPKKYDGKTVRFKGQVARLKKDRDGYFAPGRFVMTCCVEDIAFMGLPCKYADAASLHAREWVTVEATVSVRFHALYRGTGPILTAIRVTPAEPAKNEVATF